LDPVDGYISVTVISNVPYFLQLSGTDPDDGDGHSFSIANLIQNSLDDVASDVALSGVASDVANLGSQPMGAGTVHIYLCISVPVSAPAGTYTIVLTVSTIGA
jgi:hypothetical protein